ncbi:MAG: response regulator [Thermoanaerobaculum sp.]|nr:response regulator [Thermoanaerobaculum sp.]
MPDVLVVDDEPSLRDTLSFILEMEGFSVEVAKDGDEALEKVRQSRPGVVLLDVMMPKKDGYQVCQEIKGDPALAQTKVVILTAMGQAADRARALAVGADAYVSKPFDEDFLITLLRRLLGEGAGG